MSVGLFGSDIDVAVELTAAPSFVGRVRRLIVISAVALGFVTILAMVGTEAPGWVIAALALGWITMPLVLAASLKQPSLRYGLIVPASAVSIGLAAIVAWWLPTEGVAMAGWLLTTLGIFVGGLLGLWLWFRWFPVPRRLNNPFGLGRLALVVMHGAMVTVGLCLIVLSLD